MVGGGLPDGRLGVAGEHADRRGAEPPHQLDQRESDRDQEPRQDAEDEHADEGDEREHERSPGASARTV